MIGDQLGDLEDRFFGSALLGSGLPFLAMVAVSMAVAGAILMIADEPTMASGGLISFARSAMLQISNVWGVRFAGVFVIAGDHLDTHRFNAEVAGDRHLLLAATLLIVSAAASGSRWYSPPGCARSACSS